VRHPNVVTFVGACWGDDLTCLVLEVEPNKIIVIFSSHHHPILSNHH
jgi:hypothetical protein